MSSERVYPKGIITFKKHQNAPKFVLGTIVISMNDLFKWAKENQNYLTEYKGEKQLRLQATEFDGKISLSVDTWKPNEKETQKQESIKEEADGLPF